MANRSQACSEMLFASLQDSVCAGACGAITKNMALMMADCCLSSRIKGEAVSDAAGRDSRDIRDGRDWRRKSRLSRSSLMSLESRSAA